MASFFVSTLLMIPILFTESILLFVTEDSYSYVLGFCSIFGRDFYFDFSSPFGLLPDLSTFFKIWFGGLDGWTIGGILAGIC